MNNRLRTDIPEEETNALLVEEKPAREVPDNFLTQFLTKGFISSDVAIKALPFIFYLALLGMLYIGNRHLAERNIRDIAKLNKEVKELSWDYKVNKAELAFKSTLSEVAKKADTLGVKESIEPPQKLIVKEGKDEY